MSNIDWPAGFDRTAPHERKPAHKFQATLGQTTKDLATELDRLDPDDWRASIGNQHTKSNGLPQHNANPDDPGFVLRWTKDGEQFAVACDAYTRLEDNTRSVYLWVHETRMRGQRPVETGDTQFAAARLPSGEEDVVVAGDGSRQAPHELLEVAPDASAEIVKASYRKKAKTAHSDQGGSTARMKRLNKAKEAMLDE